MVASQTVFESIPPSSVFWKSLRKIGKKFFGRIHLNTQVILLHTGRQILSIKFHELMENKGDIPATSSALLLRHLGRWGQSWP